MKILLTLLLFLSFQAISKVSTKESRKLSKWQILMNLINQEIKTINKARNKSTGLKYRLIELQSEKIKLWKKKENDNFMAKSIKGIKITRREAFKKTLFFYSQTKKLGLKTLKATKNPSYKAAIYYTLALNSRDYSYDKKEYNFLQSALYYAPKGTDIRYLARTSLAEYYYNNKNYKRAVSLYKRIIKNRNDEWLTKNLYNYGWCLLKTHKFNKAINTLEEAYALSGQDFYIDFKDQIMSGLVNFYVLGKQITRGKEFILTKVDDKYEALFKYTKKVSSKGYKSESLELINLTESYIKAPKQNEKLADLRLFQYDFYKQFNDKDKMYEIAKNLASIKLNKDQAEEAVMKLAEEVGNQQQLIKAEFTKHDLSYSTSRLDRILSYFNLLQKIDSKEKSKYLYYSAETLYSVHEFPKALVNYKAAIEADVKSKSSIEVDIKLKSIDAIFSCIEFSKLNKKDESIELEYAYNKYLSLWPKGDKARKIYPKLFTLYLFDKRFKQTQKTIDLYISSFPKDLSIQKKLFNQQMDMLIQDKKSELIASKIALLYKNYLGYSQKDIKKTEVILANLLFNKFQILNKEGEKKEAIIGYQSIYHKDHYPKSVRADAAFNVGIIQIDLYNSPQSIKWFKKAFKLFTKSQRSQRRDTLEKVALRSSLLQDFLNAANIQKIVLEVYCNDDKKKNLKTYQDAIIYDLANDYITKSLYTYDKFKKCTNGQTKVIDQYILTHLIHFDHESDVISFSKKPQIASNYMDQISAYYEQKYWQVTGKVKYSERKFYNLLRKNKSQSAKLFIKSHIALKKLKKKYASYLKDAFKSPKKFEPEKFNNSLTKRISGLKPLIDQGENLLKSAHPEISIQTFDLMSDLVTTISSEIRNIQVPVKDSNFQAQFSNQMNQVAANIASQNTSIVKRAARFKSVNNLFINDHSKSHQAYNILQISDIRMPASTTVSTLDLGE